MTARRSPVVPAAVVTWHKPGDFVPPHLKPGDLILVQYRSGAWYKRLPGYGIRFGAWLHRESRPFDWCSHAMLVTSTDNNTVMVIQESGAGSVSTALVTFEEQLYCTVSPLVSNDERDAAVAFAHWTLGEKYGYASIVADGLNDLTGLHLSFSVKGRMVCSAMACRAHERLGLIPDKDPASVQPADLARYYDVITVHGLTTKVAKGMR